MEEIFDSVKAAAISHRSGGGPGFAFSRLRPKDDIVASTGGRASGPVSFLKVFNSATEAVKQGGTRRGANMGILRVDHPDILEFIDCKLDGGITNFNISVAATDRFMDALASGGEYELINPHSGEVTGRLLAKEVFDRMVRAAWRTGDPGMVFIERINASPANPTPAIGTVEATNPCGEQPLLPNEACNLGSLNVSKFARRNDTGEWSIDWDEMERVVRLAVRFLDDVIEMNPYPLAVIDETVKANRRIGLGIMGWADLLFTMGIPYDSQEAIKLADRLMAFVKEKSHDQSAKLADERGTFTNWDRSIYRNERPMRNSTDNGVSKTINLPNNATEEDVARAYRLAWELGCLGITVFRDGCKGEQVLNIGVSAKKDKSPAVAGPTGQAIIKPRPRSLKGSTYRTQTPIGTAWITITENDEHEPFEVFVQVGKGGSDTMAVAESLGRLISLILRLPSPLSAQRRLEEVISQLSRIGGGQPTGFGPTKILSLPDALSRTLAEHIGEVKPGLEALAVTVEARKQIGDLCKECGQATFIYEEGCKKCLSCGFNEC